MWGLLFSRQRSLYHFTLNSFKCLIATGKNNDLSIKKSRQIMLNIFMIKVCACHEWDTGTDGLMLFYGEQTKGKQATLKSNKLNCLRFSISTVEYVLWRTTQLKRWISKESFTGGKEKNHLKKAELLLRMMC